MTAISPTPRRLRSPRWFDLRLVLGVVLVLGSMIVGVVVVSSADRGERVWAATHELSAGVVLTAADLRAVSVRLPGERDAYWATRTSLTGQTLTRTIGAGELLPRSAVGRGAASTTITVPLGADVAPKIKAGQRITLWVSTKTCPSAIVLADAAVQAVQDAQGAGFGSAGGEDVVLRLSASDAQRVIEALALKDATIRAGVLSGPADGAQANLALSSCADAGS
jgi:hypothetical protein